MEVSGVEGFGDVLFQEGEKLSNPPRINGLLFPSLGVFCGEVEFDVGADEVVSEGICEETGGSGSAEGVEDEKIPPTPLPRSLYGAQYERGQR